jgi:hypothetical protein
MTKFRIILLILIAAQITVAQTRQPNVSLDDEMIRKQLQAKWRYGIEGGLAFASTSEIGGYEANCEIRYVLMDNLNIGARIGYCNLIKDRATRGDGSNYYFTSSELISGLIHADHYFNEYPNKFAPFIGIGLGMYDVSTIAIKTGDPVLSTRTFAMEYKFGALIRAGFEYRRFRYSMEFNLVPATHLYDQYQNTPPYYIDNATPKSNSYLTLKIGYFFGSRAWGDDYRQ